MGFCPVGFCPDTDQNSCTRLLFPNGKLCHRFVFVLCSGCLLLWKPGEAEVFG